VTRLILLATFSCDGLSLPSAFTATDPLLTVALRPRILLAFTASLGRVLVVHLLGCARGLTVCRGLPVFQFFTEKNVFVFFFLFVVVFTRASQQPSSSYTRLRPRSDSSQELHHRQRSRASFQGAPCAHCSASRRPYRGGSGRHPHRS